jgi:uncharacterized protein (DUF2235 family)
MKRLVICADGTWNVRDQVDAATKKRRPTNVTKLARSVLEKDASGVNQIVFYHDGVGTRWGLDRYTGGAFGSGIENNIREIYRFLVYNYTDGDEIFLFGFSRGAFTIRTLVGFMHKCGLVEKQDDYYVPDLYNCYETNVRPGTAAWIEAYHNVHQPRPCPPIKMVGVWDTVGSLGAPGLIGQLFNRNKYRYHDVELHPEIRNAYHALSVDEHRKPFAPSLWSKPHGWDGELVQAWFPGVHCGVGGGYAPDGLANEALHWLVERAERLGLAVDSAYLQHFTPCFNSTLFDSMTVMYRLLGTNLRKIGAQANASEVLHQAVLDRMAYSSSSYAPANLKPIPPLPVVNTSRIPRGTPCP